MPMANRIFLLTWVNGDKEQRVREWCGKWEWPCGCGAGEGRNFASERRVREIKLPREMGMGTSTMCSRAGR